MVIKGLAVKNLNLRNLGQAYETFKDQEVEYIAYDTKDGLEGGQIIDDSSLNIYVKVNEIFYKLKIDSIFFFLAMVVTGVLTQIIKHALGRPRPNYSIIENNLEFDFFSLNSSFHSFPYRKIIWAHQSQIVLQ